MPERKSKASSSLKLRGASKNINSKVSKSRENLKVPETPSKRLKNILLSKIGAIALVVIIIIALFAYKNKGIFIAAIVNGQPVTRLSVVNQLEKQGGKIVLNDMVSQLLIVQEAKNKNITITQKDINDETKSFSENLTRNGETLDRYLTSQALTRQEFEDRVKFKVTAQKILGKSIIPTNQEIDDYIQTAKDQIPENTNMDNYRKTVAYELMQQKLSDKVQTLIQDLKKKAKIDYFVQY